MSEPLTAAQQMSRPGEPLELKYARQTRNATVFIAILAGVELHALSNAVSGTGSSSSSSNCLSQGGTDPSC